MEMFVRYRIQNKEEKIHHRKCSIKSSGIKNPENYRWNLRLDLDEKWEWSSRFDAIRTRITSGESSIGFAAYQELFYHPLKSIVSGSIRYSIFNVLLMIPEFILMKMMCCTPTLFRFVRCRFKSLHKPSNP